MKHRSMSSSVNRWQGNLQIRDVRGKRLDKRERKKLIGKVEVKGWMRGSHNGPIMPVAVADATPSRFDGPPRVIGLGFQIAEGKLG